MPFRCIVPNCRGNYDSENKVSVFSFPKNEELRNRWIKAIRRKNFVVTKHSKVCERHFRETDIRRIAQAYDETGRLLSAVLQRPFMNDGAVPSIFPNNPLLKCLGNDGSVEPSTDNEDPNSENVTQGTEFQNSRIEYDNPGIEDEDQNTNPIKARNAIFSWDSKEVIQVDEEKDSARVSPYKDTSTLSLYCDDPEDGVPSDCRCDICNEMITGFRYTCVQCAAFDLCVSCESRGEHREHYVLRVPEKRPYSEVQEMLFKMRECLLKRLDPILCHGNMRMKSEIKEEDDSLAPDPMATEDVYLDMEHRESFQINSLKADDPVTQDIFMQIEHNERKDTNPGPINITYSDVEHNKSFHRESLEAEDPVATNDDVLEIKHNQSDTDNKSQSDCHSEEEGVSNVCENKHLTETKRYSNATEKALKPCERNTLFQNNFNELRTDFSPGVVLQPLSIKITKPIKLENISQNYEVINYVQLTETETSIELKKPSEPKELIQSNDCEVFIRAIFPRKVIVRPLGPQIIEPISLQDTANRFRMDDNCQKTDVRTQFRVFKKARESYDAYNLVQSDVPEVLIGANFSPKVVLEPLLHGFLQQSTAKLYRTQQITIDSTLCLDQ